MNFADQEEIAERQNNRRRKRQHNLLWNTLTAIFIIGSVLAAVYFVLLFADPTTKLNPYPPPTLPALVQLPTSTPTLVMMPATWTPQPTATSTATITPPPLDLTSTLPQDLTPTIYATDNNSKFPFASKGEPAAFANTTYHPNSDCNWQGIAGQVWDIQGNPLTQYLIRLQGYYNGKSINLNTLSGGAQAWYGKSGYEFVLNNSNPPINSNGQLAIQLYDQSGQIPMSNLVTLNTYSDCNKNLVLVNFQQVR